MVKIYGFQVVHGFVEKNGPTGWYPFGLEIIKTCNTNYQTNNTLVNFGRLKVRNGCHNFFKNKGQG